MPERIQRAIAEATAMADADMKVQELRRLRTSMLSERRWFRVAVPVSLFLAGVGIVVGAIAINAWRDFQADTDNRLHRSCVEFNNQQERSRDGNKTQLRVVIGAQTEGRTLTPEQQARLETLYAIHDAAMDKAFPDRDCTSAGIDAYFKERG